MPLLDLDIEDGDENNHLADVPELEEDIEVKFLF